MTDYYKLLGLEKNASKEEIKVAYEKQIEKIKKEVVNEKRLNQFLKMFDEAYEALNKLEENNLDDKFIDENSTLIMSTQEVRRELEDNNKNDNINRNNPRNKERLSSSRKKSGLSEKRISKNGDKKYRIYDDKEEKIRKERSTERSRESNTKQAVGLVMLPFRILALPFIAILSVIILLLQIINIVSWIATKVLIVASISVGAIHLYQVKLGQSINYNILVLAGAVLLASFFLPYILKFMLKILQTLNNALKGIAF